MKIMSNNSIELSKTGHFSTCTNYIRTIPEFRHFGQMTEKSRSPGIKWVWASKSEQSLNIGGDENLNVFNILW